MEFICKDFSTVLTSLSQVIGISEERIISTLEYNWDKQYEIDYNAFIHSDLPDDSISDDFGEFILQNAFPNAELLIERPTVHWFHGARSMNPDDYLTYGILPLSEMYPKITRMVDEIACKLSIKVKDCTSDIQRHNKWLTELKLSDARIHGGPFAMLMFEASTTPQVFGCHDYIDEPEIIANYAYMKYDTEAGIILEKFKKLSVPIIVEFIEPSNNTSISLKVLISTAIDYLYRIIHNEDNGLNSNICFSNNGNLIPSDLIVKIHRV